jgi:hypothetical protein
MAESGQQKSMLEFKAAFYLIDREGKTSSEGQAQLLLDEKSFGLKPFGQPARYIPLRDIYEMQVGDYTVNLVLSTEEKLVLRHLGRDYENFQRELAERRRDLTLSDLLMEESLLMEGMHASYRYLNAGGAEKHAGKCELRLYRTAMIMVPELNLPVRLPYSDIANVLHEAYRLDLRTERDEEFVFEQLGRDIDPLHRGLLEQIHALELAAQALVKQMMPSADLSAIPRLAALLKEGRAAKRSDIETLGASLWSELEQHFLASDAADEYTYLKSLGQTQDICIGIKCGLRAEDSEYMWFMVPIFSADTSKPGNTVIMEALSTEGTGRATYAFRMASRQEYPALDSITELHTRMGKFIRDVNRALIAINFRREPIYLTNEMLLRPQYESYRFSIARIPELQTLRRLYIGRVIHNTPEQWKADIMDLLAFNVSTTDDNLPWSKKASDTMEPNVGDN